MRRLRLPSLLRAGCGLLVLGCQLASSSDPTASVPLGASSGGVSSALRAAPKQQPKAVKSAPAASAAPSGCPAEMALVGSTCVDRYEAHLVIEKENGRVVPHPAHERPLGDARFIARSARDVLPQAYINRIEAASACENAGKRLCSVEEWYRACRGSADQTYPYGKDFEPGRCNVGKAHLLTRFFGANPRAWQYEAHFNNPMLAQQPGFLARTGEHPGCVSDYGTYDMVGNLHEWTADRVDRSLTQKIPLKQRISRTLGAAHGKGVFLGGFYSTTKEHGRGCRFVTTAHEAKYHDYSTGFRCCRSL